MDIPGEAITAVAVGIGAVLVAFGAWIKRTGRTSHNRLNASEDACAEREKAMAMRITALEERAHKDGREDRERLLDIVAQGAESTRAAAEANRQMARAVDRFAERLPDPTPPKGNKV